MLISNRMIMMMTYDVNPFGNLRPPVNDKQAFSEISTLGTVNAVYAWN